MTRLLRLAALLVIAAFALPAVAAADGTPPPGRVRGQVLAISAADHTFTLADARNGGAPVVVTVTDATRYMKKVSADGRLAPSTFDDLAVGHRALVVDGTPDPSGVPAVTANFVLTSGLDPDSFPPPAPTGGRGDGHRQGGKGDCPQGGGGQTTGVDPGNSTPVDAPTPTPVAPAPPCGNDFMPGFLNRVWTVTASVDSYASGALNVTVDRFMKLPRRFRTQDDTLVDQDAVVLLGPNTRVLDADGRVAPADVDSVLGAANTVALKVKLLPRAKWQSDVDGNPVPTFRAKRITVTG